MKEYILLACAACVCGILLIMLRNSHAAKSLALNGVAGFAAMGVVNLTALLTGVGLAVNVWTLLTAALLGLPGVTGLMLLRLVWQV
ncbi:MAG: pro-sigmaK processing inhibitor BofA family protein [Clostridia bacterium]|nr:pro-sigmaK processing inhibitor BofA family protein [Clostridia bacterium]MDR3645872.1 pro-sigmaK processing inhibitor BofA family protein [Clostridia bacterium]